MSAHEKNVAYSQNQLLKLLRVSSELSPQARSLGTRISIPHPQLPAVTVHCQGPS